MLSHSIANLCSRFSGRPARRIRETGRPLHYDLCEPRHLLAGITFSTSTGEVSIRGTDAADEATVTQTSTGQITVSQRGYSPMTFDGAQVTRIVFVGLGGDDVFKNDSSIASVAYGNDGNDMLSGGSNSDTLVGNAGNDVLFGNDGNDRIVASAGNDRVSGGKGNDRILGISGTNILNGNGGNDTIYGGIGIDTILGEAGNDTLAGGEGNDQINGNSGRDLIFGGGGVDVLTGEAGNDLLFGQAGSDSLDGGDGNDLLVGNAGVDNLKGGNGNDRLVGQEGNDIISGGAGNDRIQGNAGRDSIMAGPGDDTVYGGEGDDTIDGEGGNDFLAGSGGNDTISGGDGNDRIFGGAGNDSLNGGRGNDETYGQQGTDVATFSGASTRHTVTRERTNLYRVRDSASNGNGNGNDLTGGVARLKFQNRSAATSDFSNPAQREFVTVQPIVIANTNGSNKSASFGNATHEADIKSKVDDIFAQAGIDIRWLGKRQWNNTAANAGQTGGTRSVNDLVAIAQNGDAVNAGHANSSVVDLYFVNRALGNFGSGNNSASGAAYVGGNGAAVHIGDNLVKTEAGRAFVAQVIAHNIAHNLGLSHVNDGDNLMRTVPIRSTLSSRQVSTLLNSNLSIPIKVTPPVVTPPAGVQQKVTIQPIVVSNSDGSNTARSFGTTAQERAIKAEIDRIYRQAKVDIVWLGAKQWNNSFANTGTSRSGASGQQRFADLTKIKREGHAAGKGSSDARVIDLYFVQKLIGYNGSRTAPAGVSADGGTATSLELANGVTISVGSRTLDSNASNGVSLLAKLIAHEIGHNLNLGLGTPGGHTSTTGNLMNANVTDSNLTTAQRKQALDSAFSIPF